MAGLTERSREALMNYIFSKTSDFDTQPTIHVGLSTTTPNDTGGNITEATGGAYARVATVGGTWNSAATAATVTTVDNASTITFPQATGDWSSGANITHAILYDAAIGGNVLGWAALGTAKPVLQDDTASFAAGELNFTMAPV